MSLKKISDEIDKYLAVMPKSNVYSVYRQKETKDILLFVYLNLRKLKPHHTMLPELQKNIESLGQWDNVTREGEDTAFELLLDKIKKDLVQIKTLASI